MNYSCMFVVFIAVLKLEQKEKTVLVYAFIASALLETSWATVEYLAVLEPRPNGTFFNPNYFAGYIAGVSAWVLSEIISAYRSGSQKGLVAVGGIILLLLVIGISVSGSRGGVLALGTALFFVGLAIWGVKIFPALIVIALLFLLIPNPTMERLRHISEQDIYAWSRLDIWMSAFSLIADNPLGVGTGMYRFHSPRYAFPVDEAFARYGQVAETAHNAYLDMAAELGIMSALIIIFVGIFLIVKALKAVRKNKDFFYAGTIGVLASVMAQGGVDSIQKSPPSDLLAVVSAGILFSNMVKGRTISLKVSSYFKYLSVLFIILAIWFVSAPGLGYEFSERAKRYMKKGDFENAQRWQTMAIKVCPSNADFWYQSAQIESNLWAKSGKDELYLKSLRSLESAQELNPLNTNYHTAMAGLIRRNEKIRLEKKIEAMIELYKKTIELAPYNATFYVELAKALMEKGDYHEAEKAYRKAIELEPRYASAMALYGDLLLKMDRKKEAVFYYKQALNIVENIKDYKNRKNTEYEKALWRFDVTQAKRKLEEISN